MPQATASKLPTRNLQDPNSVQGEEPSASPGLPVWEESYPAAEGEIVILQSFSCAGSAEAVQGVLAAEGVDSEIFPKDRLSWSLQGPVHLLVEARIAHRARWVLDRSDISDAELSFLATGELRSE